MLVNIYMKFHEDIFNGFQVTERTRFCDRQTDGLTGDGLTDGPTIGCLGAKRLTSHFSVHPYGVFVQTNAYELFCLFFLRGEIVSSCFEATKLPNVMRFHQQPSKQYVCRKKNIMFVIFGTRYRLHRLEMMSQLMWIPPNFGQVSSLMWIFPVGQADCLILCGLYNVYSNNRKKISELFNPYRLRGRTDRRRGQKQYVSQP